MNINNSYITTHNYGPYTDLINKYITQLLVNSKDLYTKRYINNNPTGTQIIDQIKIEASLGYIDDYLYYFYQFNNDDFVSILSTLIDKLKFVTVFPSGNERGLFGEYVDIEKTLYINPELSSSRTLTSDERTRLYICHELGHVQNSLWMKRVATIVSKLNVSYNKQLLYDGFSLLDEATTQDRAENITYYYSHKIRPYRSARRTQVFSGRTFESNFDYYGEMQVPAIRFARSLRGIGKINNDESAMKKLDQRALKEDFADKIFDEYEKDNRNNDLYFILEKLGKIKNAVYAVFGRAPKKYLYESLQSLEDYNKVVVGLRDYREPRIHKK